MIGLRQNPPMSDPARIAIKLSLPIEAVRALQRRGFLVHFGLSDIEVRERLWQAHRLSTSSRVASSSSQRPNSASRTAP